MRQVVLQGQLRWRINETMHNLRHESRSACRDALSRHICPHVHAVITNPCVWVSAPHCVGLCRWSLVQSRQAQRRLATPSRRWRPRPLWHRPTSSGCCGPLPLLRPLGWDEQAARPSS